MAKVQLFPKKDSQNKQPIQKWAQGTIRSVPLWETFTKFENLQILTNKLFIKINNNFYIKFHALLILFKKVGGIYNFHFLVYTCLYVKFWRCLTIS